MKMDLREIFSSDLNAELHRGLAKERKIKIKHGKKGRTKVVELTDTTEDRVKVGHQDIKCSVATKEWPSFFSLK